MSENNDFIQLPPIKKDTPSEVVSMIWQYLKLPEESRKRVKAELINVHENCGKEDFQIPNLYDIVPKEEIAEFEDIMRKIITGIISEASGIATWVYVQKITALLYFITSLLFYVSAILNFTSDVGMGVIYLCLGSTSLCFGATWLNKNKKDDDNK